MSLMVVQNLQKATLESALDDRRLENAIKELVIGQLDPMRIIRLMQVPKTYKALSQCETMGVIGGLLTFASIGLEPNNDIAGHGWMLPFREGQNNNRPKAQIVMGYKGFLTLGGRCQHLGAPAFEVFCKNDEYDYDLGSSPFVRHKPALSNRGDIVGAYATVPFYDDEGKKHGERIIVLGIDDLHKVRDMSANWKGAKRKGNEKNSVYGQWPDRMFMKAALKRAYVTSPIYDPMDQGRLKAASNLDTLADVDSGVDFAQLGKDMDVEHLKAIRDGEAEPPLIENQTSQETFSAPTGGYVVEPDNLELIVVDYDAKRHTYPDIDGWAKKVKSLAAKQGADQLQRLLDLNSLELDAMLRNEDVGIQESAKNLRKSYNRRIKNLRQAEAEAALAEVKQILSALTDDMDDKLRSECMDEAYSLATSINEKDFSELRNEAMTLYEQAQNEETL